MKKIIITIFPFSILNFASSLISNITEKLPSLTLKKKMAFQLIENPFSNEVIKINHPKPKHQNFNLQIKLILTRS